MIPVIALHSIVGFCIVLMPPTVTSGMFDSLGGFARSLGHYKLSMSAAPVPPGELLGKILIGQSTMDAVTLIMRARPPFCQVPSVSASAYSLLPQIAHFTFGCCSCVKPPPGTKLAGDNAMCLYFGDADLAVDSLSSSVIPLYDMTTPHRTLIS